MIKFGNTFEVATTTSYPVRPAITLLCMISALSKESMSNWLPVSCSNSLGVSGAMKPYQLYRLTLGGLATAVFRPTLNKEAVKRVNRHTFFIGFLHAGCQ
ncbi:hypothetical protein ALO99_200065 [Pseudomonas coronafaciens pv. porri]|nr:hypothetical protein ALP00_200210 [Pseudomonas coronafaciens pv. porri]RMW07819.1 hypothetical protein ALO99_200065 [Pseudomonas coronafaciens pv. porri]